MPKTEEQSEHSLEVGPLKVDERTPALRVERNHAGRAPMAGGA